VSPLFVDAHLDLAYNALRSRDLLRPAREQPPDDEGTPAVGLPDLRAGGVGLICGTLFCEPAGAGAPAGYTTADEAHTVARAQLAWYAAQSATRAMRLVRGAGDLPPPGGDDPHAVPLPAIVLMEGADPIRTPDDVAAWADLGVRAVGLAWKRTRYAGGTGDPGPLTPAGRDLVPALDAAGMIHDASHLAEDSFWELLDAATGPVMASHSNCRALIPTDRQLSDDMIRALAGRGGVIGVNFYDRFLIPPGQYGRRRATLADVVQQVRHLCDVTGDPTRVGLGTDMDGGFGCERLPMELRTAADLPKVAAALAAAGFGPAEVRGIMGENWLAFFRAALPPS